MSALPQAPNIERVASIVQKVIAEPSSDFLNNIIDAISDPVFVKDQRSHFLLVNAAFCQFVGHTREELMGRTDTDFFPAEQCEVFYEKDRQVFATGQADVNEEEISGCDGDNRIIRTTKTMFLDRFGQPILVGIITDLTALRKAQRELESANEQLHRLAHLDRLTGLPNRMAFEGALRSTLKQAQRHRESFALLFMDLNGFKNVNDTYGHPAGDELIIQTGERLQKALRDGDLVARLGGDEFVVIARHTTGEQAEKLAERLNRTIKQPVELQAATVEVSTSIGIARFPDDGDTEVALIKNADMAMYRAKRISGKAFEFFDQSFAESTARRHLVHEALKSALLPCNHFPPDEPRARLDCWFQPIVDLRSGENLGYEALARLSDPILGPISPLEFVGIAEQNSLIEALGENMLRRSCELLRTRPEIPYISVNVSNVQLRNPCFANRVEQCLKDCGVSGHRLTLEITESSTSDCHAASNLRSLCALGVQVWIDDFGTGYSNLSLLRKLPLHGVKLDRAFVSDLVESSAEQTIVRAIIAIARELGLGIIAEGVEHEAQRQLLLRLGVTHAQGYLFARPAPWRDAQQAQPPRSSQAQQTLARLVEAFQAG